MATATTPKLSAAQSEMLKTHRTLTAEYSHKSGAEKAGVSRKLNALEVEMIVSGLKLGNTDDDMTNGADFRHFVIPSTVKSSYTLTVEELTAKIAALRDIVAGDYPDVVKATATRELDLRVKEADKRGIAV